MGFGSFLRTPFLRDVKRCPACGRNLECYNCHSTNVSAHGFYPQNHRHVCHACGEQEVWYE